MQSEQAWAWKFRNLNHTDGNRNIAAIFPNQVNRAHLTTKENGERLDSGLRKLGAMIGDGSQLGCNVVTNPGCIIYPGKMIRPNETVSGRII